MFCYEMSKMSKYIEDHVIAVDKPQGYIVGYVIKIMLQVSEFKV